MTQNEKDLLLKDLCGRLPYKPIVHIDDCGIWDLRGVDHDDSAELRDRVIVWHGKNYPSSKNSFPIINCKPYLFPMSSMTEEQKYTCPIGVGELEIFIENANWSIMQIMPDSIIPFFDWLHKNHFDYRGLIPLGLAIDATGKDIY